MSACWESRFRDVYTTGLILASTSPPPWNPARSARPAATASLLVALRTVWPSSADSLASIQSPLQIVLRSVLAETTDCWPPLPTTVSEKVPLALGCFPASPTIAAQQVPAARVRLP